MVSPGNIVAVLDCSQETLRDVVAHLELSATFEELVYRESELDAIWSITAFALLSSKDPEERKYAARLHQAAQRAHDLTATGRVREAAAKLRELMESTA